MLAFEIGLCARTAPFESRWFTRRLSWLWFDCGKPCDPITEVIGEHKRAAPALDGAQFAQLDRLIK